MKRSSVCLTLIVAGTCAALAGGCSGGKHDDQPAPGSSAPSPAAPAKPADAAPAQTKPADSQPADAKPTTPAAATTPAVDVSKFSTVEDYESKPVSRLDLNSGMIIEDLKVGDGAAALPKAMVTFHYRGKVQGDKEFDCTLTREGGPKPEVQPLNKLFDGLAGGMIGMKPGGRRRLTIPPFLASGIVGMKDVEGNVLIPSDATLIYVIDMVEIKQQVVATPAPAALPAAAPGSGTPTAPAPLPAPTPTPAPSGKP